MKRLSLYVFWEKDGIVRNYVSYYLSELHKISEILVIVNGNINIASRNILQQIGCQIFTRNNHGQDFGAWNDAIKFIGLDQIKKYDQLILCNFTCYGPIYPFEEMFKSMEQRNCDFW